ncbi:Unknown protein, partial [Striga hermonthica]
MERANILYSQNPKNKSNKSFKYEHVWNIMKDFTLFECTSTRRNTFSSQPQSDTQPESPISPNPELSNFSINLSDENASGGSSSQRPLGTKKSKFKRKQGEDVSAVIKTMKEENKKFREMIRSSV